MASFIYLSKIVLLNNFKEEINWATEITLAATNPDRIYASSLLIGERFFESDDVKRLNMELEDLGDLFFDRGIDSIYLLSQRDGIIYFVAESTRIGHEQYVPAGSIYNDAPTDAYQAFSQQESFFTDVYTDEYGTYFTEFTPIFAYSGELAGVIGIDVNYDYFEAKLFNIRIIGILGIMFIYIVALLIAYNSKRKNILNSKVQKSNDKIKAIVDSIPDGVICFDRDEKIVLWNHACNDFFGYKSFEALGKKVSDVINYESVLEPYTRKAIKNFEFYSDFNRSGDIVEMVFAGGDGDERVFEVSFKVFESNSESLAIAIFRDMSNRKNKESEILEQKEKLEKLNTLMLDREAKMMELKERLSRFENGN